MRSVNVRSLTIRYVLALGLVGLCTLASHLILTRVLYDHEGSAFLINTSGRQRMLTQRIASLVGQRLLGDAGVDADLAAAIDLFEANFRRLRGDGDSSPDGPGQDSLDAIYEAQGLSTEVRDYVARARRALAIDIHDPHFPEVARPVFAASRQSLLRKLDAVVAIYQRDSEQNLARLGQLQTSSLVVVFVTLLAEAIGIFRPMVNLVIRHTAELHRAKVVAEAASRVKSDFLANVSHEIRTPMNAIMGLTNLTLETSLTQVQHENLEIVRSAADALLVLIEDLLDLSRIEAGKIELDPLPFRLRDHVGDTLNLLALRAHSKGLEVAIHVHPDVPDHLVGDAARLRQVLINLIGNAIKFTAKGEVVVEVERAAQLGDQVELRFGVRDCGIGIPEDKRQVIFQPFVQADGSTTRHYGGTGLGLAISSHLVELMGGRIRVDSEIGRGSTFHFNARFSLDAIEPGPDIAAAGALRDVRTLVVDDNEAHRLILGQLLRYWGMRVTTASGASEALAAIQERKDTATPFALVILDVQMPEVDGYTLARSILDDPACDGRVVLMLSATDRHGLAERGSQAGISAYLHKPIRENELRRTLLKVLDPATAIESTQEVVRAEAPPKTPRALCILVAEDNPHNQRVVELILAKDGHSATIVNDGRQAVATWRSQRFDLVLMDVQMPEMDGFQATAAIRAAEVGSGRHVPIVGMTAFARKEDRDRCLAAGMDGYVSKPIDAGDLRAAIDDCASQGAPPRDEPPHREPVDVWDPDAALQRVDGDLPFLREMASILLEELPGRMGELRDAIEAFEPDAIGAPAHTLKNWFGNFVATRAVELIGELEDFGHNGDVPGARTIFGELERETERLVRSLEPFAAARDAQINLAPIS